MTQEFSLRDYVNMARRRAWLIGSLFLAALAVSLLWSAAQTPLYRSTARILINQASTADIFDPVSGVPVSYADRVATNEVALLRSQLVRTEAQERLGYSGNISASAESRADVVVIASTNADPARAQEVAQTYAEAYLDIRRSEFVADRLATAEKLLDRIATLDAEIAGLGVEADTTRQTRLRNDLADSYDRLVITADLADSGSARIIDDARRPVNPVSPRTNRNLALGGVLGLMAGLGAALLLEGLDRSIKSRAIVESLTPGVPALAIVPAIKSDGGLLALDKPDGVESEVFRTLRAGLDFASIDSDVKVIQVTSPGASAGKTTIAANLAVVMAQAGQRVAVVDADLRRPRVHEAFSIKQVPGLTSVILGRTRIPDAATTLRLNNGGLWVFPSGPLPPGPSELLGSERARKTFDRLRASVDVIIVDSAPVLPVADALVLSRLVDATLLVANAKLTKRDELVRAFNQLEHAGANVIGTVLNQVKTRGADGYGYGYGYGYGAEAQPGLFGRNKSHAPRHRGTEMLKSSELPRFEAAKLARPAKPAAATADAAGGDNGLKNMDMWLGGSHSPDEGDTAQESDAKTTAQNEPASVTVSTPAEAPVKKRRKGQKPITAADTPAAKPAETKPAAQDQGWGDDIEIRT